MKRKSLPSGVSSFLASVMAILLGGLSNLKNMGQVPKPLIMTGLSVDLPVRPDFSISEHPVSLLLGHSRQCL